jgi:hypothetical protein
LRVSKEIGSAHAVELSEPVQGDEENLGSDCKWERKARAALLTLLHCHPGYEVVEQAKRRDPDRAVVGFPRSDIYHSNNNL